MAPRAQQLRPQPADRDARARVAVFVAAEPGPVTDDYGRCQLIAAASFDQVTSPDVVVIGGTLFNEEPDQRVVRWLRQVHPSATWTTSVCTGSIYLAAAGILDGHDATTHWARADELERRGAHYTEQRVVEHGKVITAAGVSAGIDMALTLLARMHGPQIAEGVQLAIEYDPSRRSAPVHRRKHPPRSWSSCGRS